MYVYLGGRFFQMSKQLVEAERRSNLVTGLILTMNGSKDLLVKTSHYSKKVSHKFEWKAAIIIYQSVFYRKRIFQNLVNVYFKISYTYTL